MTTVSTSPCWTMTWRMASRRRWTQKRASVTRLPQSALVHELPPLPQPNRQELATAYRLIQEVRRLSRYVRAQPKVGPTGRCGGVRSSVVRTLQALRIGGPTGLCAVVHLFRKHTAL